MPINILVIALYFVILAVIGVLFWRRSRDYSEYNLAGRRNSRWVTGISHQAAAASGWLLLGLPGAAYLIGVGVLWTLVGWILGSLINWFVLARRLRAAGKHFDSSTIFDLFAKRSGDNRGLIIRTAAVVLLVIMTINSSAELIAIGKVITVGFGLDSAASIIIGAAIVMSYTMLGGFLAISWANLLQGLMMVFALVVVPLGALASFTGLLRSTDAGEVAPGPQFFDVMAGKTGFWPSVAFITLGLGIALMFPGYVHSLPSLMAIKRPKDLLSAGIIATVWGVLALLGAASIGIMGRYLVPNLEDPETVLLSLSQGNFPEVVYGALAAAILAASLSSICAYILAATSSIGASLLVRDDSPQRQRRVVVWQRFLVVVISAAACILAFNGGLVFEIALFAAAGLGAAFGPLVFGSLFSTRINTAGALASMVTGLVVVLIWHYSGAGASLVHEVFPGVIASSLALILVSRLTGGPKEDTRKEYERFQRSLTT